MDIVTIGAQDQPGLRTAVVVAVWDQFTRQCRGGETQAAREHDDVTAVQLCHVAITPCTVYYMSRSHRERYIKRRDHTMKWYNIE